MNLTRHFIQARYPSLPSHSRIFVHGVPRAVGLIPSGRESPALRFWYGDTTLRMLLASRYEPREAGEPGGPDYFFAFDSTGGWSEQSTPRRGGGATPEEREGFAEMMWKQGNYRLAAREYEALADSFPVESGYAFNAGSCLLRLGDSTGAARWYRRAAGLPGAAPQMVQAALKYDRFLRKGQVR